MVQAPPAEPRTESNRPLRASVVTRKDQRRVRRDRTSGGAQLPPRSPTSNDPTHTRPALDLTPCGERHDRRRLASACYPRGSSRTFRPLPEGLISELVGCSYARAYVALIGKTVNARAAVLLGAGFPIRRSSSPSRFPIRLMKASPSRFASYVLALPIQFPYRTVYFHTTNFTLQAGQISTVTMMIQGHQEVTRAGMVVTGCHLAK